MVGIMSLRTISREIRRTLTFWMPIKNPPRWVVKASAKYTFGGPRHLHNFSKIFVGKHRIYKYVNYVGTEQGQEHLEKWYVKKRIR